MAAGIGSRFGTGIKQLEPVDDAGHIIMDYSIHDAIEAGFNHVVFIIRKDIEKEFKEVIGDRIAFICSSHAVLKLGLRQPTQLIVNLGRINGITHIMTLTVANMGNQALRLAQLLTDDFHNLDVLLFIMTADIVDFAHTTLA